MADPKVLCFLRTFMGQYGRLCSLARFPVEEFENVKKLLDTMKWRYTNNIGSAEYKGYHAFTHYDHMSRKSFSFCLRRKNGEPYWNICQSDCDYYIATPDDVLLDVFSSLKKGGATLVLPSVNFEYISPITS